MVPRGILVSVFALVCVGYGYGCRDSWTKFGSMCYKAMIDIEDWTGAYTMCKTEGAELAEITSQALDQFLAGLGTDNKTSGYWIGMTDAENEDTWQWVNTKAILTAESYTNWGPSQPDNGQHDQNCAFLNAKDNGLWYDGHCAGKKDYICQMADGSGTAVVG